MIYLCIYESVTAADLEFLRFTLTSELLFSYLLASSVKCHLLITLLLICHDWKLTCFEHQLSCILYFCWVVLGFMSLAG